MIPRWPRRRRTPPLRDWPVIDARSGLAAELAGCERRLLADLDVPPPALVAEILEGIAEAERGETVSLGSFAAYCEDDGVPS